MGSPQARRPRHGCVWARDNSWGHRHTTWGETEAPRNSGLGREWNLHFGRSGVRDDSIVSYYRHSIAECRCRATVIPGYRFRSSDIIGLHALGRAWQTRQRERPGPCCHGAAGVFASARRYSIGNSSLQIARRNTFRRWLLPLRSCPQFPQVWAYQECGLAHSEQDHRLLWAAFQADTPRWWIDSRFWRLSPTCGTSRLPLLHVDQTLHGYLPHSRQCSTPSALAQSRILHSRQPA